MSVFADDVALTSDGGGKVNAAKRVVHGAKRLANLHAVSVTKYPGRLSAYLIDLNGEPGLVEFADGYAFAATSFSIEGDKIVALYRVMNPDKLSAFQGLESNLAASLVSQRYGDARHD